MVGFENKRFIHLDIAYETASNRQKHEMPAKIGIENSTWGLRSRSD